MRKREQDILDILLLWQANVIDREEARILLGLSHDDLMRHKSDVLYAAWSRHKDDLLTIVIRRKN